MPAMQLVTQLRCAPTVLITMMNPGRGYTNLCEPTIGPAFGWGNFSRTDFESGTTTTLLAQDSTMKYVEIQKF
jgi:hypothetical protein